MPHRRHLATWITRLLASASLLLVTAQAPALGQDAGVYRCGNAYGSTPCPGCQRIATDDARSEAQRDQARAVQRQTSRQADALADERRAREQAASGQLAVRIGPSDAERRRADAQVTSQLGRDKAKAKEKADAKKADEGKPRRFSRV